jgi:hypothetical protein
VTRSVVDGEVVYLPCSTAFCDLRLELQTARPQCLRDAACGLHYSLPRPGQLLAALAMDQGISWSVAECQWWHWPGLARQSSLQGLGKHITRFLSGEGQYHIAPTWHRCAVDSKRPPARVFECNNKRLLPFHAAASSAIATPGFVRPVTPFMPCVQFRLKHGPQHRLC